MVKLKNSARRQCLQRFQDGIDFPIHNPGLSIIISIWVLSNSYAQHYTLTESEPYYKLDLAYSGKVGYKTIYLIKNKTDTITNYEVGLDMYYSKSVKFSKVTGIDGIKSKVKVDISTMGCCSSITTYYYFITVDDKIVSLNKILNVHCDGPQPKYDLIFPDNKNGVKNLVYLGRLIYDQDSKFPNLKIKYTELISPIFSADRSGTKDY